MRAKSIFFVVFVFLSQIQIAQTNDHIPLTIFAWTDSSSSYYQADTMAMIFELNPESVCLSNIDSASTDFLFQGSGVNLIPYNLKLIKGHDDGREKIVRYSSAMYSEWEADGSTPNNSPIKWRPDFSKVVEVDTSFNGNAFHGIRTNSVSGQILEGPGIFQYVQHPFYGGSIRYEVRIFGKLVDLQSYPDTTKIGTLIISGKDKDDNIVNILSGGSGIITKGDLNQKEFLVRTYDLSNVSKSILVGDANYLASDSTRTGINDVKINLIWDNLNGITLYISKAVVTGNWGSEIHGRNDSLTFFRNIERSLKYLSNVSTHTERIFGFDEPGAVDQHLSFNIVDKQVSDSSYFYLGNHINLTSAITTGAYPHYIGSSFSDVNSRNSLREFITRAEPNSIGLTKYIYHYPKTVPTASNIAHNISLLINNLKVFNELVPDFPYTVQGHEFNDGFQWTVAPTESEMFYHMCMGLMYGAKEIRVYNFFSEKDTSGNYITHGLTDLGQSNEILRNSRYYFVKDKISPLLHGRFGNLLYYLTPDTNKIFHDVSFNESVSQASYFDKVYKGLTPNEAYGFDIAEFTANWVPQNNHYFMFLNRPYPKNSLPESGESEILTDIRFKNLSTNRNWSLFDIVNNQLYEIELLPDTTFGLELGIAKGEGGLYHLLPTIESGGILQRSETISSVEFDSPYFESLVFSDSITLTVSDTFIVKDTIILSYTNLVTVGKYGNVILADSGVILSNSQTLDLINAKSSDYVHPKLIWAKPIYFNPYRYEIYRSNDTGFVMIADSVTNLFYTDSTVNIYYGDNAGHEIEYFVKGYYNVRGGVIDIASNVVEYSQSGGEIGKRAENIRKYDYILSNNYPNPFNPATTIRYSLGEDSRVKIVIYNILGEKIKLLVNEIKPAGEHEVNFNAGNLPSGIYFCRMEAGKYNSTKKLVLTK